MKPLLWNAGGCAKRIATLCFGAGLLLAGLQQTGAAATISASVNGIDALSCTSPTGTSPVASGTATASETCTYSDSTATLSASSSILSLGASVSATGGAIPDAAASYTEFVTFAGTDSSIICPGANGIVECYGGGAPNDPQAGTQLTAAFYFTVNGTLSGNFQDDGINNGLQIDVNDTSLLNSSGTGELVSSPFDFYVGTAVKLGVSFNLEVACAVGGCSADFADPELTDLVITDPSTGLPVLGLTAVGDDGTVFPVDVGLSESTPTPEPSYLVLLAAGLVALGIAGRRRLC